MEAAVANTSGAFPQTLVEQPTIRSRISPNIIGPKADVAWAIPMIAGTARLTSSFVNST